MRSEAAAAAHDSVMATIVGLVSTLSEIRRASMPDGVELAYRTMGAGPVDLLWSFNQVNDVEAITGHRPILEYFDALAAFARVIVHDRRGMGRSTGTRGDLETDVADVRALLDVVGAERPFLASADGGGAIYAAVAAKHPDRVSGVVWHGAFARRLRAADYPWGASAEELERQAQVIEQGWGTEAFAARFVANGAPALAGDAATVGFYAAWMRATGSARAAADWIRGWGAVDLRPLLSGLTVPVLVLDRAGDLEESAHVASLLPRGRFRGLEGDAFIPYYDREPVVAAIREFVEATSTSSA